MTLTPFMILILAAFAVFVGVLGVVSIWSNAGVRREARGRPAVQPAVRPAPGDRHGEARTPVS